MDKEKRVRKIFEILRAYPDGISGEFISRQIGVSSRTVRSDIKILQKMISEYAMTIKSAPRKGYMMDCRQNSMTDKFVKNVLTKETERLKSGADPAEYIICRLLKNSYMDVTVTQSCMADELYISISTLKLYFNECKSILGRYNIKIIHYKKNGLKLNGEEVQIRNCIFDYADKNEKFYQMIFADINMISIDEVISKVLREREMEIPDTDKTSLCLHTAVAISRARYGKSVSYPVSLVKRVDQTFEYNVAKDILEYIYAVLGIDVAYDEVYYITQCLLASKKFFNTATSRENLEAKKIVWFIVK